MSKYVQWIYSLLRLSCKTAPVTVSEWQNGATFCSAPISACNTCIAEEDEQLVVLHRTHVAECKDLCKLKVTSHSHHMGSGVELRLV